jgi:hypothetical protein
LLIASPQLFLLAKLLLLAELFCGKLLMVLRNLLAERLRGPQLLLFWLLLLL